MRPSRPTTPPPLDPDEARKAAYAAGLRLLAGRDMSTARVGERLRARGFSEAAIEATLERLTRAGVLDDARAVRAAARTLATVRQRGRHRVSRELERLGFAAPLAEAAIAEIMGDVDERAMIARLVASRLHGHRSLPDAAAYRRIYGTLLRRGFPSSIIRDALEPYWKGRHLAVDNDPDE
ncbi:MAG: RecX family transcriptional regulator [Acidobacteria bacterium]|nr:RecX family transcriptional regulator [Acidobacteriota bacterium]